MKDIVKAGIILMVYALVAGAPLAYLNLKTTPVIEENRLRSEELTKSEVLPGMEGGFEARSEGDFQYWVGYKDQGKTTVGGGVFIANGKGYSSTIQTMVGVDTTGTITGMKVLFQQETPGLGVKVAETNFIGQFLGKKAQDDLKVKKDSGDIDSITGATISSRAVTNSVNTGLKQLDMKFGG